MKRWHDYPKHPSYPDSLAFHVGAVIYHAVISNRLIYDAESCELEGCAIEGRRLIVISCTVELCRREEVVIHELTHAWAFAFGKPIDEESRCQVTATIAIGYMRDIEAQGGRRVLVQMPVTRTPRIGMPKKSRRSQLPMQRLYHRPTLYRAGKVGAA